MIVYSEPEVKIDRSRTACGTVVSTRATDTGLLSRSRTSTKYMSARPETASGHATSTVDEGRSSGVPSAVTVEPAIVGLPAIALVCSTLTGVHVALDADAIGW